MNLRHGLSEEDLELLYKDYSNGVNISALSKKYGPSQSQVKRALERAGIDIRKYSDYEQFRYDVNFFKNIDTEVKAYFLGLLYSDGCISTKKNHVGIDLKEEDSYILSILSKVIVKSEDITRPFKVKGIYYGRGLHLYSKTIVSDLINLGCMSAKTFKIRLPILSEDMMCHFLRGYFDGDGCFNINNGHSVSDNKRAIFKVVSNTLFCSDVVRYFDQTHQRYLGVYHPSPNKDVGAYQTGNDEVIKFLYRFMYKDSTIFIRRKKEKFEDYFKAKNFDPYNEQTENKNKKPDRIINKLPAQEIIDRYIKGEYIINLAKIYTVAEGTISKLLKRHNVRTSRGPRKIKP